MKNTQKILLLFFSFTFFIILSIFVACTKSQPMQEPAPDPNPPIVNPPVVTQIEKDTIYGTATLHKFSNRISPGGIKVTVFNSKDSLSLIMKDNQEVFLFDSIPYGTYDVRYEKNDMGTFYRYNLVHAKNTQPTIIDHTDLGLKSAIGITYFSIKQNGNTNTFIQVPTVKPTIINEWVVRYFFSRTRDVSSLQYDTTMNITSGNPIIDTFKYDMDYSVLKKLGFASGTKLFIKAYSDSWANNAYVFPGKRLKTYPNLNPMTTSMDSCIVQ